MKMKLNMKLNHLVINLKVYFTISNPSNTSKFYYKSRKLEKFHYETWNLWKFNQIVPEDDQFQQHVDKTTNTREYLEKWQI